MLLDVTPRQLRRAANIKERIEKLEKKIANVLTITVNVSEPPPIEKQRGFSAATRAKIARKLRRRWRIVKASGKNHL